MSNPRMIVGVAALAVAACTASPPPQPQRGEPTVSQREISPTVSRMVCELQEACGHIGPGQAHASVAACITDTVEEVADAVDIHDCKAGASMVRINACLDDIKKEACPGDVDVRDVAACDDTVMCVHAARKGSPLLAPEMRGGPSPQR